MLFFNTFQDPVVRQDGYSLLGARLSFETLSRRWYGALFASNLLDELYAQTMIRQDPIIGNLRFWGAPRTYGIQIGVRY
ncbi:MAG: hypothetical protein HYR49_10675 [Gammaproteobacteria bacterium]|nr:hypothetical protein [Gammaproteobacteria bacterium]